MFWRRKPKEQLEFLVFGLGNPGINYVRTRHNVGWWVVDELARKVGVDKSGHRHKGQVDYCKIGAVNAALIKPTTFMNRSGQCVAAWLREHHEARFAVVYDDISMQPGKARIRREGTSGGHKGIKSIISALGAEEFDRIKLGVGGPPEDTDAADYVLEPPAQSEEQLIMPCVARAVEALFVLAAGDFDGAMSVLARVDGTPPGSSPPDLEKQTGP